DINPDEIEKKLLELGAEKTFSGLVTVNYFDKENGEIRDRGDLLRVRQFGDNRTEVCYKANKRVEEGFKVCDEYHLSGSSFSEAVKLFKHLGYAVTCSYEKRRTSFLFRGLEIVIDQYPNIPPFIEIEGTDTEAIERLIRDLGLTGNERSSRAIGGLLQEKYPKVQLNGLTF
ncbi:CYTH domain-containing protein, partial [Candidatus Peregrinibacteria bacterium]|nr:CYTH domain-containing protein [Candidatus Peregrinibacteria bacterium]